VNFSAAGIFLIGISAFISGISKTGFPGAGIVVVPLVASVMDPRASTGFIVPMLVFGDCLAVIYWRRRAVWKHILRVAPWTMLGVVLGFFAMSRVSDAAFKPALGLFILLIVGADFALKLRGSSLPSRTSLPFAAVIGILAGAMTMMANAAGPIMTIYLLSAGLPKEDFVGTGAWFYFILNLFKVPFSIALGLLTWQSFKIDLMLLPLIVAGGFLGVVAMKRMPQKTFELLARVLAAAGGLKLLIG
jgi:uncharacterized membrane protein YfcA